MDASAKVIRDSVISATVRWGSETSRKWRM